MGDLRWQERRSLLIAYPSSHSAHNLSPFLS